MLTTENILDWLPDNLTAEHRSFIGCDFSRLEDIAKQVTKYGLSALSPTLVTRAIRDLGLTRQYDPHEDAKSDQIAEAIRKADATPLTRELGNQLTEMTQQQVAERFHSDLYFQRLYTRASNMWGFKLPLQASQQTGGKDWSTYSAADYHRTSSADVRRQFQQDEGYRRRINEMLSQGII